MSDEKKPEKRTGDQETDEILESMEEDGEKLPVFKDPSEEDTEEEEEKDEADGEEKKDAEASDDEEEEEDEESEDDEDESEEDEEEEEDETKTEGDEEDEEEGDEDEEEPQAKTPLWKRYKEAKKKAKELQGIVDTLSQAKTQEEAHKKFADFAAKHKLNPEVATGLIELAAELAAQKIGIDPKTKGRIDSIVKSEEQRSYWDRQDKLFRNDFRSNVAPLVAADGQDLAKVMKSLHSLAFKPGNEKKSLVTLYLESKKPGKKVTSEGGKLGARSFKSADLDNVDDLMSLSDEDFDKASDNLAKQSKTRIVRS